MMESDPGESSSDDRKQNIEIDTDNLALCAKSSGCLRDESTTIRSIDDSEQKLLGNYGDEADQRHVAVPPPIADIKSNTDKKSHSTLQHDNLSEKADDEKPQAKSSRVHSNSKGSKRQRCAVAQEGAIPVSDLRIEYDEAKMNLLQVGTDGSSRSNEATGSPRRAQAKEPTRVRRRADRHPARRGGGGGRLLAWRALVRRRPVHPRPKTVRRPPNPAPISAPHCRGCRG
jgi:hypothetical protein